MSLEGSTERGRASFRNTKDYLDSRGLEGYPETSWVALRDKDRYDLRQLQDEDHRAVEEYSRNIGTAIGIGAGIGTLVSIYLAHFNEVNQIIQNGYLQLNR